MVIVVWVHCQCDDCVLVHGDRWTVINRTATRWMASWAPRLIRQTMCWLTPTLFACCCPRARKLTQPSCIFRISRCCSTCDVRASRVGKLCSECRFSCWNLSFARRILFSSWEWTVPHWSYDWKRILSTWVCVGSVSRVTSVTVLNDQKGAETRYQVMTIVQSYDSCSCLH